MGQDVDPFDVEDSGYDFAQLVPREPAENPVAEQPGENKSFHPEILVFVLALTGIGFAAIFAIIIMLVIKLKKKKQ